MPDEYECPVCKGGGMVQDVNSTSIHYRACRFCKGTGYVTNILEAVKDFKTWPDSIRRMLGVRTSR